MTANHELSNRSFEIDREATVCTASRRFLPFCRRSPQKRVTRSPPQLLVGQSSVPSACSSAFVMFGSKADIARCNLDARFAGKQLRVHGVFLARRCLAQRLFPRVRNFRLIAAINHPCERNRTQDRGKRDHLRTDDQLLGTTRAASNRESWALGSWSCCGFAP
jgi:hypothetical protein